MRVSINVIRGHQHAERLCRAFSKGIPAAGDTCKVRTDSDSSMDDYDAALFWGFTERCQTLVVSCQRAGIPWVYLDLAYWSRDTHYKVCINDRHPRRYVAPHCPARPDDRWRRHGLTIQPWKPQRPDSPIVLAGMSGKAAWSWGMKEEAFERDVIRRLRGQAARPIVYRPKPSWHGAKPLPGAQYDNATAPGHYDKLIAGAHCVITHHSNAGVDALIQGVPAFTRHGAAAHLSANVDEELHLIESPHRPEGREEWVHKLAYWQWTVDEMTDGSCWRFLRSVIEDFD